MKRSFRGTVKTIWNLSISDVVRLITRKLLNSLQPQISSKIADFMSGGISVSDGTAGQNFFSPNQKHKRFIFLKLEISFSSIS